MWWWYWIIFAILFGWCWWWWWFCWRWWWLWWCWWWIPIPPRPDPPPYDRIKIGRLNWISLIAAGIGGGVAWGLLGERLAPDGGLLSVCLIAAVGATFLGSLAVNLAGAPARSDAAP